jgi:hypothetical protein
MSGVAIPASQNQALGADGEPIRGEPLTVSNATVGYMCPVQYFDKMGRPHVEMVFVVDGVVYKDPNGEQWASRLKVMSNEISKNINLQVKDHLRSQVRSILEELGYKSKGTLKAMDDIDVLSDKVDKGVVGV